MKYIAIVIVIIMFIKIDVILGLFDKVIGGSEDTVNVETSDIKSKRETIPVAEDKTLKQVPKEKFFALLEDFRFSPMAEIREKALKILKDSPSMFTEKLDPELETHIYRWRDLLNNNEPEAVNFLVDLINVLEGENLETLKRFFSLWMDINMEHFLNAYANTKDLNCSIATTFGDAIPEEEKANEFFSRHEALKMYLTKENINPVTKQLANNCLMQLEIVISKIAPSTAPDTQADLESDPSQGEIGQ